MLLQTQIDDEINATIELDNLRSNEEASLRKEQEINNDLTNQIDKNKNDFVAEQRIFIEECESVTEEIRILDEKILSALNENCDSLEIEVIN